MISLWIILSLGLHPTLQLHTRTLIYDISLEDWNEKHWCILYEKSHVYTCMGEYRDVGSLSYQTQERKGSGDGRCSPYRFQKTFCLSSSEVCCACKQPSSKFAKHLPFCQSIESATKNQTWAVSVGCSSRPLGLPKDLRIEKSGCGSLWNSICETAGMEQPVTGTWVPKWHVLKIRWTLMSASTIGSP